MVDEIAFTPSAERALRRLDSETQRRVGEAIVGLATNPRPPGYKKLVGSEGALRIRVGSYRVVYQVRDRELVIVVIDVGHRREVYR